ncbi:hypothetical protein EV360DRAFT_76614, partial [Lentinula raphanica]
MSCDESYKYECLAEGNDHPFNLRSQDSGSQEFCRQFPDYFVYLKTLFLLSHLTEATIPIVRILFRQLLNTCASSFRSSAFHSQGSGSQEFAGKFLISYRKASVSNFKFYACQHSQKASYFKTLFHITVQMLFLPTSFFLSVSRLVLLYMTATVGMHMILASPVPTGTQVGVTQGPEGIPIYLVLDYQGIDRRAYVGFGTNPETIVGLQYAGKVPPGRIQDHVVVRKPSFIDLKSGTSNVQLLKRVNIGFTLLTKEKDMKSVAEKAMGKTEVSNLGSEEGIDIGYATYFVMNAKTQIDLNAFQKQVDKFK